MRTYAQSGTMKKPADDMGARAGIMTLELEA